jgi:hypothetical protein
VVGWFGAGGMTEGFNKDGINFVLGAIDRDPDLEIEFVEAYDDVCARCTRRVESATGSIWGEHHTCPSAEDPQVVEAVQKANQAVLGRLGLAFGAVVSLRDLVSLLRERVPDLSEPGLEEAGGADFQETYELGLGKLSLFYERRAR